MFRGWGLRPRCRRQRSNGRAGRACGGSGSGSGGSSGSVHQLTLLAIHLHTATRRPRRRRRSSSSSGAGLPSGHVAGARGLRHLSNALPAHQPRRRGVWRKQRGGGRGHRDGVRPAPQRLQRLPQRGRGSQSRLQPLHHRARGGRQPRRIRSHPVGGAGGRERRGGQGVQARQPLRPVEGPARVFRLRRTSGFSAAARLAARKGDCARTGKPCGSAECSSLRAGRPTVRRHVSAGTHRRVSGDACTHLPRRRGTGGTARAATRTGARCPAGAP